MSRWPGRSLEECLSRGGVRSSWMFLTPPHALDGSSWVCLEWEVLRLWNTCVHHCFKPPTHRL